MRSEKVIFLRHLVALLALSSFTLQPVHGLLKFSPINEITIGTEITIDWTGQSSLGSIEQSVVLMKDGNAVLTLCQGQIAGSGQCSFELRPEHQVQAGDGYQLAMQDTDGVALDYSGAFSITSEAEVESTGNNEGKKDKKEEDEDEHEDDNEEQGDEDEGKIEKKDADDNDHDEGDDEDDDSEAEKKDKKNKAHKKSKQDHHHHHRPQDDKHNHHKQLKEQQQHSFSAQSTSEAQAKETARRLEKNRRRRQMFSIAGRKRFLQLRRQALDLGKLIKDALDQVSPLSAEAAGSPLSPPSAHAAAEQRPKSHVAPTIGVQSVLGDTDDDEADEEMLLDLEHVASMAAEGDDAIVGEKPSDKEAKEETKNDEKKDEERNAEAQTALSTWEKLWGGAKHVGLRVRDGWAKAQNIIVGDALVTPDGDDARVGEKPSDKEAKEETRNDEKKDEVKNAEAQTELSTWEKLWGGAKHVGSRVRDGWTKVQNIIVGGATVTPDGEL
ncbi:hypothetical protein BGX23_012179 [Mortierella sp. AD031]|nr:hypothetical protein BGX23_012179 [Mortierella sp. AD031]